MPTLKNVARRIVDAAGLGSPARRLYHSLRFPHLALPFARRPSILPVADPALPADAAYRARLEAERERFDHDVDVHALPGIFHYWSNKYLGPKVRALGFQHPDDFFVRHLLASLDASRRPAKRILSIGAGNCDTEVRVAAALVAEGARDFRIECLELNPNMLARGRQLAEEAGVADYIVGTEADFNRWAPQGTYEAVMANQSLHHVTELERLFESVRLALEPGGRFVVSDIIGRNGHMRWPEALEIVDEFWRELPRAYRYNHLLQRHEELYDNWDCSTSGFEGIRAQDILPLLIERFSFESFLAFSNVIDPFVDRAFGHNFSPDRPEDLVLIDNIEARDEAEILLGRVKPTHMFAVLHSGARGEVRCLHHLTPEFCLRRPV